MGILGRSAVGWVAESGRVTFADGSPDLAWHVAADDRWYDPEREVAVRRTESDGLPIITTRMRVPGGDIVHTVWCATGPNASPIVVVDVENDSPMPVAVAFTRTDLTVSRPISTRGNDENDNGAWPAPGLSLDKIPTVMPVGHRGRVRVAVGRDVDLGRLPDVEAVARGWVGVCESSSRLVLPDLDRGEPLVSRVNRAKVAIALSPEVDMPWRDVDSLSGWLLDRFHAHRLGIDTTPMDEVAGVVERIIRKSRRRGTNELREAAVRVGAMWLSGADVRAAADVDAAVRRAFGSDPSSVIGQRRLPIVEENGSGAFISSVEESMCFWNGAERITLCADGIDGERLGSSFEAHGLPAPDGARISMAVRWHGSNAAILWGTDDSSSVARRPFELRSGVDVDWSSSEPDGEGLWRIAAPSTAISDSESVSFG